MSKIVRWEPASELVSLRDAMNRLFEDSWVGNRGWTLPAQWAEPTVDMYETADNLVIKAAVPGVKPEEVEITVQGNYLTITGETKQETENKDKNYLRRESRWGSFTRT